MNKHKFLLQIVALSESHPDLLLHPEIIDEIFNVILGSGHESEFLKQFARQIKTAEELGPKVVNLKTFEVLKQSDGLYSMHLNSSNYNLRILYNILDSGQLLLHCFHERGGKKATDYTKSIPIALKRKKELEGLT